MTLRALGSCLRQEQGCPTPGARTGTIGSWTRRLLPTAPLLASPVGSPADLPGEAIVLDEEEVASGPLSPVDDLLRNRQAPTGAPTG